MSEFTILPFHFFFPSCIPPAVVFEVTMLEWIIYDIIDQGMAHPCRTLGPLEPPQIPTASYRNPDI